MRYELYDKYVTEAGLCKCIHQFTFVSVKSFKSFILIIINLIILLIFIIILNIIINIMTCLLAISHKQVTK